MDLGIVSAAIHPAIGFALGRFGYPEPRLRETGYRTLLRTIVGQQVTRSVDNAASTNTRIDLLLARANADECEVIAINGKKMKPHDILAKLNGAMSQVLTEPATKTKFAELGLDVAPRELQTPEGLAKFQQAEIDKWALAVRLSGAKAD